MDGWNTPTTETRNYRDLPKQAQEYVEYIEVILSFPAVSFLRINQVLEIYWSGCELYWCRRR
jgi:adenylosuccinate synthase